MSTARPVIVWFRQDLRLRDNPALSAAAQTDAPLLPVYVQDDENAGDWAPGGASRWWLHQSLRALRADLRGRLELLRGDATEVLPALAARVDAQTVYWNECHEPWRVASDRVVAGKLRTAGREVRTSSAAVLFEPATIGKADGTSYRVFTPYFRRGCLRFGPPPRCPLPLPQLTHLMQLSGGLELENLELVPKLAWPRGLAEVWSPGEDGAQTRLAEFLRGGLDDYAQGRDRPDRASVSRLSPHLHFGELSPQQAWYAIRSRAAEPGLAGSVDRFSTELGWREFSYYLLHHWPELPRRNLQARFDHFPWRESTRDLKRWQRGRTGIPIVDAGMRELWQTGYMHNRVRMLTASFLVKNLLIHWHRGAEWFWDTLVDADLANNTAGWQWVAGCGADAAPYFRIFNPVVQGRKFDPEGAYVRRYVPELARLPNRYIHAPWEAPAEVLHTARVGLGRDYPLPIVELAASRARALAAFKSLPRTA